jgi:L-fuconolactonase
VRVDAQVHVWESDRPDRPWPAWGPALDHGKGHALGPDEVAAAMARVGVDRAVLVPPSFEGDRNDVVLAAARARPTVFGALGRLPLDRPIGIDDLEEVYAQPGMLGVRLVFVHGGSAEWLRDGTADWFWPAAEKIGMPVAVLAPGQAEAIGTIAADHPGLRIVVDHLGIATQHPKDDPLGPVVAPVLALAELPNVAVKASALQCFTSSTFPHDDLAQIVRDAVAAFGAGRVFWGSDLSRVPCSYEEVLAFFDGLDFLADEQRDLIMGEGLLEWLGWAS